MKFPLQCCTFALKCSHNQQRHPCARPLGGMDKYSPVLSGCINLRLRKFAPGRAKSPEHKPSGLCFGCISLSNAEGLGKGLCPPRKLPADTPRNPPKLPPEQIFSEHEKATCLKLDISVPKQAATFTPLFAAFRLLFSLILRA